MPHDRWTARLLALALALASPAATPAAWTTPAGGGGAVELEPVPAASAPRSTRRRIYVCATPGLVEFADRPCGPHATSQELRLRVPDDAPHGAVASVTTPAAPVSMRAPGAPRAAVEEDERVRRRETCERLDRAVRALDDRMRAGYGAREAARLWAQWREAKSRLRDADCRGLS